ncbi:MAG: inositol monophosphatase family protein [Pseudonocardiales bacterium]|nr:inositol monophosphatase family protein [Pseudonocardiales bacterium]
MDPCRLVDEALTLAGTAARAGGAVLRATDRSRLDVDLKDGRVDLTTSADRASQAAVVAALREAFPEHRIVGEEGTEEGTDADHVWYVDGLDGTSNFAHGLPWYAVSVGLRCRGEVVAGAVFDPVHDELFAAGRGRGATGNGVPLRVADTADVGRALVVTQIQSADPARIAQHAGLVHALLGATGGVRSPGAPALIMAHIAAGHYTAYVERAMPPWDITAGQLLLEEAGGRVTDLAGTRVGGPAVTDVLASNGAVHDALLAVIGG